MRIAHLSDLHVLDWTGVRPWHFLGKRITGVANLLSARRDAHSAEILVRAVADLLDLRPDHVVVTGDVTNLSLDSEFRRARELLAPLGGTERLTVIPGNHDTYTRGSVRRRLFERHFADLLWAAGSPRRWPCVKEIGGGIRLVGLLSARAVPPLMAYGWVGPEQLAWLEGLAPRDEDSGHAFTLALVHHNLHSRGTSKDRLHGLRDAAELLDACAGAGVDMILHGHTHVAHRFEHGPVTVVGCGSSTWTDDDPDHIARYNVYRIEGGELVETEVRIYDPATEKFAPGQSLSGVPPRR